MWQAIWAAFFNAIIPALMKMWQKEPMKVHNAETYLEENPIETSVDRTLAKYDSLLHDKRGPTIS